MIAFHRATSQIVRRRSLSAAVLVLGVLGTSVPQTRGQGLTAPGFRARPAGLHALTGGVVETAPGRRLDDGVILIRDGRIEGVGEGLDVPAGYRVWELNGAYVYPGFIDPYLETSEGSGRASGGSARASAPGLGDRSLEFFGVPGEEEDPGDRGAGHEVSGIHPQVRLADTLAIGAKERESFRRIGYTAANVAPKDGILGGIGAAVSLGDAGPNASILKPEVFQHLDWTADSGNAQAYPRSLMGVISAVRQALMDGRHYQRLWSEYQRDGEGSERPAYNAALESLAGAIDRQRVVLMKPGSVLMVDRGARVAREFDLRFAMLASGEEWRRPDLVGAVRIPFIVPLDFPEIPKLPSDADWDAVSLDQLRAWDWAPENPALLRGLGLQVALTTHDLPDRKTVFKRLSEAIDRGLSRDDALAGLTAIPAELCGLSDQLGTISAGKIAHLTIIGGDGRFYGDDVEVQAVWIDGIHYPNPPKESKEAHKAQKSEPVDATILATEDDAAGAEPSKADRKRALRRQRHARAPLEGRGVLKAPDVVWVRNAILWTCDESPEPSGAETGVLPRANLVIRDGKIVAVGPGVRPERRETESIHTIDATGYHVTPGLIDAHSHSMIVGGVNESTLPSTAMVRIGDVINSETANLYRQLAGGLTVANNLHGSANPIGGQNAVIKLRDGAGPEALKFRGAPEGIKFALGENVKQSNWGDDRTTRFPQTRMGVPVFFENRFTAASQYRESWRRYRDEGGVRPRRDLELEAIGEIIEGSRLIHCHSYRQDEIVAFLRVMERFGVRVGTLQHCLEGYKVADEIRDHGAGASLFSDWWAYKFEVIDAIPYAGSVMHERGALVSFNSDSSDVARRMYTEAAKAVKYGGTSETDALRFVTLFPARQLGIDDRVGSLEVGKDGDFAIWSRSPLDSTTTCLETWIDGRQYFDRARESKRIRALEDERAALLSKIKVLLGYKDDSGSDDSSSEQESVWRRFFRVALELQHDHETIRCLDCARVEHDHGELH